MRSCAGLIVAFLLIAPGFVFSEVKLPPIVASLELDRDEAFIKEQILVIIRVGFPPGAFGMTQSSLKVTNAELFSLHKTEYVEDYQGQPYRFVETRYALFGNAAGKIELSGIKINATLPVASGGANTSSNPAIDATIEPQSVVVREMSVENSPDASDRWLAASDVVISSVWPAIAAALNPGVPVTRQVTIKVSGQHPAAVSESLAMELPDGLRAYPAPAITTLDKTPEGLRGLVQLPVTLVAGNSGEFVLPEISLPWWDINDRQWRFATLPAEHLDIVSVNGDDGSAGYRLAIAILAVIAAALGLLSYVLWQRGPHPHFKEPPVQSEKHSWRQLKKAIKNGSDVQLRQAIATWFRQASVPNFATELDDCSAESPRLPGLLDKLDQRLYARDASVEVDRKQLLQVLTETRRQSLRVTRKSTASNKLYPQSIMHSQERQKHAAGD